MVDNIKLNRVSPLLSSTERIKRVDRKQHDSQQPPFEGALKDDQKKKKKKKKKEDGAGEKTVSTRDSSPQPDPEAEGGRKVKKKSDPEQVKKIIDIRV
jgi:hypothetical protein